jgi:hypothetical protein
MKGRGPKRGIVVLLGCLQLGGAAFAVEVDVYQHMVAGSVGEVLTPAIMNASSHGGCGAVVAWWELYPGGFLWGSDQFVRQLPGRVLVGGVDRSVVSTRTWRFRNKYENNYAIVRFATNQWGYPTHPRMTVACFYTSEQTATVSNSHDTIEMGGNTSFGVLQTIDNLSIRAHSCTQPGWVTTVSADKIMIAPGRTYWVNLHYDGVAGKVKVAVFDPDNGFAQVGTTVEADSVPGSSVFSRANFGNCSPHGNWPDNETSGYFSHILIDFTNAVFPLLPDLGQTGFYPLAPCRVFDTRSTDGPAAGAPALAAYERRVFAFGDRCGVPADAHAVTANVTVVDAQAIGDLRITGSHIATTSTSVLAIPLARARANNAIIQLAPGEGSIAVTNDSAGTAHVVMDVNGYFK